MGENADEKDWSKVAEQAAEKEQQDVEQDAEHEVEEALAPPSTPEEFEAQLNEADEKYNKVWNQLLATKAELENTRRRAEREVQNAHKYGSDKLVSELVPVVDAMEKALEACQEGHEAMEQGIQLTLDMLLKVLEKHGIEQVSPEGEAFNPDHHEAVSMQEGTDQETNTVIAVIQKGYLLNGRLVRPAMVVVAK